MFGKWLRSGLIAEGLLKNKHTPTPWKVRIPSVDILNANQIMSVEDSVENIARCYDTTDAKSGCGEGDKRANAAFIVRAVNSHEALVEALGKACASVENQANWDKPPYSEWYYSAKALIKSLE